MFIDYCNGGNSLWKKARIKGENALARTSWRVVIAMAYNQTKPRNSNVNVIRPDRKFSVKSIDRLIKTGRTSSKCNSTSKCTDTSTVCRMKLEARNYVLIRRLSDILLFISAYVMLISNTAYSDINIFSFVIVISQLFSHHHFCSQSMTTWIMSSFLRAILLILSTFPRDEFSQSHSSLHRLAINVEDYIASRTNSPRTPGEFPVPV